MELEVFMMGFLPGFPYLGLLPEIFDLPRRVEPRVHVPPRSISVAARQTTIYTIDSPGGWHVIGQIPISILNTSQLPPVDMDLGDQIKLNSIDQREFETISKKNISG